MSRVSCTSGLDACACRYFELSSNRRDIWFGEDMSGSGKFRSDWNLAMLQDAVAPTFARLLMYAAQVSGCSQTDRADLILLVERGQACSARLLSGWCRHCLDKGRYMSNAGSQLSELLTCRWLVQPLHTLLSSPTCCLGSRGERWCRASIKR